MQIRTSIPEKHRYFLGHARAMSLLSPDPSTKCGAILVNQNGSVTSCGWNAFPDRCEHSPDLYANRELKYARVVRAEIRAILNCNERPIGYTMFTWPPSIGPSCSRCAASIIQSGITSVIFCYKKEAEYTSRWVDSIKIGLSMYNEAGINVVGYYTEI